MPSYSRPASPRPMTSYRPKMMTGGGITAPRQPQPQMQSPQAQGRGVVNQGGQRGVMGDGGNFQPLGNAALSKLTAGGGAPGLLSAVGAGPATDGMRTNGTALGANPADAGIEGAIGSLKQQLGMDAPQLGMGAPPTDEARMAMGARPMPMPYGEQPPSPTPMERGGADFGPAIQQRLRSMTGGGLMAPGVPKQPQPQQPQQQQNPYAEILRQRLAMNGGGGVGGVGGGQFA